MASALKTLFVAAVCFSAMGCCKKEAPPASPKLEALPPQPLAAAESTATGAPTAQDVKPAEPSPEDAKVEAVEFSLSWSAADSQIKTGADAAAALGVKDKKPKTYEIKYYKAPEVPEPARSILRERNRTDKGKEKFQLMHKIRSINPVRGDDRKCVLENADKKKYELDVSLLGQGVDSKYSFSCTAEDEAGKLPFPESVMPEQIACSATMLRYEQENVGGFGEVTIEQWTLGDKSVFVEVSVKREGADADPAKFRELVKGLDGKVIPLAEGMTQQVANCAERLKAAPKP